MLPDKSTLSGMFLVARSLSCLQVECNIGPGKPNTLHLSIRPADFVDDECISLHPAPVSNAYS